MATNVYLNSPSVRPQTNEKDLMEGLIVESIQAAGMDMWFFRKDQLDYNELFAESATNVYRKGFEIEMYLTEIQNFNGDNSLFTKFGLNNTDRCTLQVAQARFEAVAREFKDPLFKPLEDDLIYMPYSRTVWRIRKVKEDPEYLKFGKNYVWRLECSLYDPTHEDFQGGEFEPEDFGEILSDRSVDGMSKALGLQPTEQQNPDLKKYGDDAIGPVFDQKNPFGEC